MLQSELRERDDTNLSHLNVSTLLGQLHRQPRDLLAGVGDRFGAVNEILLAATFAAHELRQLCHENRHAFRRRYNLVLARRPLAHLLV